MSHQAITWVMEFSRSRLADRLVLGAIAHRVSNDSGDAWPSVATIAREANVSERQVYLSIEGLKELGELMVYQKPSERGTNKYHMPKFMLWMRSLHPSAAVRTSPSAALRTSPSSVLPSRQTNGGLGTSRAGGTSPSGGFRGRPSTRFTRGPESFSGAKGFEAHPEKFSGPKSGQPEHASALGVKSLPGRPEGVSDEPSLEPSENRQGGRARLDGEVGQAGDRMAEEEQTKTRITNLRLGISNGAAGQETDRRSGQGIQDSKFQIPEAPIPTGVGKRTSEDLKLESSYGRGEAQMNDESAEIQESTVEISDGAEDVDATYARARRAYRRATGKTLGGLGPKKQEFGELVSQHGADAVVRAIGLWGEEVGRDRCRELRWPLAVFLADAEEYIEAATEQDEGEGGINTAKTIVPRSWRPE